MDVVKVERDELDDTHYCYKDSPVQCWCCRSPGILPTFLGQADRRVCDVVAGWWIREMVKRGGPAPSRSPSRSRSSKLWRRASCASLVGASERPCAPIGGASHVLGMAGPESRHGHSVGMGVVLHHLALGRRLMPLPSSISCSGRGCSTTTWPLSEFITSCRPQLKHADRSWNHGLGCW